MTAIQIFIQMIHLCHAENIIDITLRKNEEITYIPTTD